MDAPTQEARKALRSFGIYLKISRLSEFQRLFQVRLVQAAKLSFEKDSKRTAAVLLSEYHLCDSVKRAILLNEILEQLNTLPQRSVLDEVCFFGRGARSQSF
jgi:hypothetical protein